MSIYSLTDEAIHDLDDIYHYLSNLNLDAAARFVDAFEQKCETVAKFPRMGKSYEELAPQLRGVPLDGYIILYRLIEDGIEVIRVVSGYRNLESLFSESDDS